VVFGFTRFYNCGIIKQMSPVTRKKEIIIKRLNMRQDLFCKIYATDPECMGSGTYAYMKAYGIKSYDVAKASATQMIAKPHIMARINEYIDTDGFNDMNVDKQLGYVVNQHKDLHAKVKGIQEYNKLKKRIINTLEIVIPKPIMELEDDEVVHKINKSNVKEMENTDNGID
jgi:hypothetical protein